MQVCQTCSLEFAPYPVVDGKRLNLRGRRCCTDCVPIRHLRGPRKRVFCPPQTKVCEKCGEPFPAKVVIDGKRRHLYRRRFCLNCSPFGVHNTSRLPPGRLTPDELREHRRRRRNQKTYRYQKKRRKLVKAELIQDRGGRCQDCGYSECSAALEFHHRDPATKEFGIGNFGGSWARLLAEVEKCDLLCATCHRIRHALLDASRTADPVVEHRRRRKVRAVRYMGGCCDGCGRRGPPAIFEFHHRNAKEKDFGLSESGIPRRWEKIVAELAKCVMLCANCHREVHAGVRELDEGLLGLAEEAASYTAA